MRREYQLSDSAGKKHIAHFMKLLAAAAVLIVATLFLGLKQWKTAQYIWVNILLLGEMVFCVNMLANFGGRFDGKENKEQKRKKFLIVSAIAAAVLWLILTIMGTPLVISGFIFIADLLMTIGVAGRTWEMLKNMWKTVGNNEDGKGRTIHYPGEYVLHEVHTAEALTSPFGKVLFYKNAVLFVFAEMGEGFVLVNPNGTMELKKNKLIKNEVKENKMNVSTIMSQAEDGIKRVSKLVEEICKKKQIPVPAFCYDFMLFLPNFDARNVVWDQGAFENMTKPAFWNAEKKYKGYLHYANKQDYFQGKACYKSGELQNALEIMAAQSDAFVADDIKEQIVAELAQICELEQSA